VGLGLFALIEKPFDIREVVQICEKAVKQHQSSKIRFSDLDEFLSSRRTSLKIT
jgi:DNA-binding NtrC family response regulator